MSGRARLMAQKITRHLAGPLIGGVQTCTRCGFVIVDGRGAMVPAGQDPVIRGFREGPVTTWGDGWPTCFAAGDPAGVDPLDIVDCDEVAV